MPTARRPAFTRFNVFLRDRFACQYCDEPFPAQDLTFDHVVPRSRGGRTTWENKLWWLLATGLPGLVAAITYLYYEVRVIDRDR